MRKPDIIYLLLAVRNQQEKYEQALFLGLEKGNLMQLYQQLTDLQKELRMAVSKAINR